MALWVVFAHTFMSFDIYVPEPLNKIFNVAFAVEVFIILSGFVIFLLLDIKNEGYTKFITRRFFRIFPVYWFLLLVSILLLPLQQELWVNIGSSEGYWQGRMKTIESSVQYFNWHVFFHIPLLQGIVNSDFLPASDFAFLEPAWSLSLEWQFYLIAPILFWAYNIAYNQQKLGYGIIIIFGAIISSLYGKGGIGYLPKEMHFFLVGIFSYYLWKNILQNKGVVILVACISSAIILRSIPLLIWFSFMAMAISEHTTLAAIRKLLETKIFDFFAKISYPIYLVHTMVIYIPVYLNSRNIFSLSSYEQIAYTIILSILIGYLIHLLIEKPGINVGRKLTTSTR